MRKKGAELVFLGELPDGEEVIDFYHAAGHLDTALAAAYGDTHGQRTGMRKDLNSHGCRFRSQRASTQYAIFFLADHNVVPIGRP